MSEERGNVITIDDEGHLHAEPEARRRLAVHTGRYRVVPTTGELVLLQRTAQDRREASSSTLFVGRVALAGDMDAIGGLIDVIHFISGNNWTGQLAVIDRATRKTLHFRRGDIRTAGSNLPEDCLGAILYRYGVVTEDALAGALHAGGAARLGQLLVEKGAMTAHELYTYVRKQVEEIFFSLLVMRRGSFYFYRTGDDEGPSTQLKISTKLLLFEGVRRIDELSYFREKLPSTEVVLVRREPQPLERIGPREQRVLGLVDGVRDLGAVARASHLGEFETTKTLFQLLQAGFVQLREQAVALEAKTAAATGTGETVEDLHSRVVATFNDVYARVFAAVSSKGSREQLVRGLESFFASTTEFAPLFVGVLLQPDGRLGADALLANLHFAPSNNKLDYLHRGLSDLLYFELFTAGEAVDRREELELHERLDQILNQILSGHASGGDSSESADGAA